MGSSTRITDLFLGAAFVAMSTYACAATPDPARIGAEAGAGGTAPPPVSSDDPNNPDPDQPSNGDVTDPFAADVTYESTLAFDGTNASHALAGGADAGAPTAAANPDCLSCHGGASPKARPTFATGGLVLASQTGDAGSPCAQCEVLFVDSTGHRVKITTAPDGTFALLATEYGAVSTGTRVGVRKGTLATAMPAGTAIEAAGALQGCNSASCHLPSGTGPIVLGTAP